MQDLRRALAAVRAVAVAGQGDRPPREVLGGVCREVALSLGFDRVGISRTEERPGGVAAVGIAGYGAAEEYATAELAVADAPTFAHAWATRELVYVADARAEPALPQQLVEELDVTSLFVLPLLGDGRCVGFLAGDRGGVPFRLDELELELLRTIGALTGTLLEKELLREEMRRLDAAKTQFVAFASHELRSPIQAVYGLLATLHHRGSHLSQDQLRHLRATAFEQAERLRRLVDQLLDLSRLDAGALSVERAPTHVRSLLEEIVLVVAERRAQEVEVAVADDLEAPLDRVAVDRVVSNLLANALRYGAPPVRVEAERADRHVRIRVLDAGRGIDADFLPALFDRFTRSRHSEDEADGSGLGLAIARSYARAQGGELLYSPRSPCGACFELVVPAEAA